MSVSWAEVWSQSQYSNQSELKVINRFKWKDNECISFRDRSLNCIICSNNDSTENLGHSCKRCPSDSFKTLEEEFKIWLI